MVGNGMDGSFGNGLTPPSNQAARAARQAETDLSAFPLPARDFSPRRTRTAAAAAVGQDLPEVA